MTSAAPARKPYRKAPPQHRETRHALPVAPPPSSLQHDISQVKQHTLNTPPTPLQYLTHLPAAASKEPQSAALWRGAPNSTILLSDSELDISSLSSLELCIPPPPLFSNQTHRPSCIAMSPHHAASHFNSFDNKAPPAYRSPVAARKHSLSRSPKKDSLSRTHRPQAATPPKSILKQPPLLGVEHAYDIIRKSKSVEMLDNSRGEGSSTFNPPSHPLDRTEQWGPVSRRSSDPPSPSRTNWNWKMQALEEKVRFSNFLDEITCRVMSPAHLMLLGRTPSRERGSPGPLRRHPAHKKKQAEDSSADRTRRWDEWVAAVQRPGQWYKPLSEEGEGQETQCLKGDIPEGVEPKEEVSEVNRGVKMDVVETKDLQKQKHRPVSNLSLLSHIKVGLRRDHLLLFLLLFLSSSSSSHSSVR